VPRAWNNLGPLKLGSAPLWYRRYYRPWSGASYES